MALPPRNEKGENTCYAVLIPVKTLSAPALTSLCMRVNKFIDTTTTDYVWHDQPLHFTIVQLDGDLALRAQMHYADSVEDEWLAVWLIREISLNEFVVAHVVDSTDGYFLAAEAADCIPSWLEPDVSEYRIFIYRGELHIIPDLKDTVAPAVVRVSFVKSIAAGSIWVVQHAVHTRADERVQVAIRKRLAGYPSRLESHVHVTKVHVPAFAAHLLVRCPRVAAQAVGAFYSRDPIETTTAAKLRVFNPAFKAACRLGDARGVAPILAPPELLPVSVRLTRCLFAQLGQQRYHPPRSFMTAVPAGVGSGGILPPSYSLGARITIGLEILLLRGGKRTGGRTKPTLLLAAAGWPGFTASTVSGSVAPGLPCVTPEEEEFCGGRVDPGDEIAALLCDTSFLTACATIALPPALRDDSTTWLTDESAVNAELVEYERFRGSGDALSSKAVGAVDVDDVSSGSLTTGPPNKIPVIESIGTAALIDEDDVVVTPSGAADGAGFAGLDAILASMSGFMTTSSDVEGVGSCQPVSAPVAHLESLREDEDENSDDDSSEEEEDGGSIGSSGNYENVSKSALSSQSVSCETSAAAGSGVVVLALLANVATLTGLLELHSQYIALSGNSDGSTSAAIALQRSALDAQVDQLLSKSKGGDSIELLSPSCQRDTTPDDAMASDGFPGFKEPGCILGHAAEPAADQDDDESEPSLHDMMSAMDSQLYGEEESIIDTNNAGMGDNSASGILMGCSFARMPVNGTALPPSDSHVRSSEGNLTSEDVGHNLLESFAESMGSQAGASGPTSSLLGQLGVTLPPSWWVGAGSAVTAASPSKKQESGSGMLSDAVREQLSALD
jgi:hypothetical protein